MKRMRTRFVIIFCLCVLECSGLNCRSEGKPKDEDIKKIYRSCLKRQESNGTENQRSANNWMGQGRQWNSDNKVRNRENKSANRNMDMGSRERKMDSIGDRDDMHMGSRERQMDSIGDRDDMQGRESRSDMNYGTDGRYNMGRSNDRSGNTARSNNENDNRNNRLSGRDGFLESDEFGSEMPKYNYYNSQSHRRNKRERRVEKNSGQRSQYNPNSHKSTGTENYNETKTSSSNFSKDEDKACALHCFLENLEMTDENGMPDRYLVTHAITKDMKNEDLKDFLQESIEECFQILDNENTDNKCEFSKNLLLCLSEKGRANCDDWKDDYKF